MNVDRSSKEYKDHCLLSWKIIEMKYAYYVLNNSPIPDQDYDHIEKAYVRLGEKYGWQTPIAVDFNPDSWACRLVVSRGTDVIHELKTWDYSRYLAYTD